MRSIAYGGLCVLLALGLLSMAAVLWTIEQGLGVGHDR